MLNEEVIKIVAEKSGKPASSISESSTLLGDLGLDGDDAWEVIERCHDKYNVDFSSFYFSKHFRNEPCFKGIVYFYRKIKYKDEHIASKKEPVTVSQLIKSCESGSWLSSV